MVKFNVTRIEIRGRCTEQELKRLQRMPISISLWKAKLFIIIPKVTYHFRIAIVSDEPPT
jgi:hypothetical protein